jgi:predicted DNA-binding transcriptional regulator YafY
MRRADRLFSLLMYLRRPRAVTARELARQLEVSERTVYRDIRDLSLSGVPVEGEAGVGYRLRPGFEVPPLMFNKTELTALRLGAQMVRSWADPELAKAAESAQAKIECALPPETARASFTGTAAIFVPDHFIPAEPRECLQVAREALEHNLKLALHYQDVHGKVSQRVVRPLGLAYWGRTWTLAAWCELRSDYRDFRVDRIHAIELTTETIPVDAAISLEGYLTRLNQSAGRDW